MLRPSKVLGYYLKHNNMNMGWDEITEKLRDYISDVKFNDYPKKVNEG